MQIECKAVTQLYVAIPDLPYLMLVSTCHMLIACISTFQNTKGIGAPWTQFFEGSCGLCWDLNSTPTHKVLMGLYSRLQFLPSHFLLTFEEAFYIGFFEHAQLSRIFSPIIINYPARYVAIALAKEQNPYNMQLMSNELHQCQRKWQEGLTQIWDMQQRDAGTSSPPLTRLAAFSCIKTSH